MSKRLECNREIIRRLSVYIEQYPDIRLGQALSNLNIVQTLIGEGREGDNIWANEYYLESCELLKRMR